MRKFLVVAALCLGVTAAQAQEKVMNVQKTDGTTLQTRVTEVKQISFLTVEEGGKGLQVKTVGGEVTSVLFEARPVVTLSSGKMTVKSNTSEAVVFEIENIAEITFGDAADPSPVSEVKDFALILQHGGALLSGIPQGTQPLIYSIDGRAIPVPDVKGGELRLSRATLGTGIFIVKVGKFTTKIQL